MPVTTEYKSGTFYCPGFCSGDAAAAKKFYTGLFGWTTAPMGDGEGQGTMFQINGTNVAGMYQMADDRKAAGVRPHWNSYLMVDDLDALIAKLKDLGGEVRGEPFDADDAARMVNLQDPEGVRFSAWQPTKAEQDATLTGEPGSHCWTELATRDAAKAATFYSNLMGWVFRPFEGGPMPYQVIHNGGTNLPFGGMFEICDEMGEMPPQWISYFMVKDIDAAVKKAIELGGISHGIIDIEGTGRIAMLQDGEKAGFALIQPKM